MKIKTTCIVILAAVMALTACTKEGNTVYQPDPNEPKASTKPLVTVIYGTDAVGDRSYSDLIYKGIEEAEGSSASYLYTRNVELFQML